MLIKVCGVTTEADAAAAAAGGATAIGFNFYASSPRYVTPERAAEIGAALPVGVLRVGVFVDEPAATVERVMSAARLDVAQLHGTERPGAVPAGLRVWKAFRITPEWNVGDLPRYTVDAFLLDGPSPGQGAPFDWKLACNLPYRVILAGGLDHSNVGEAIRLVRPWGVDVCSRIERAPGLKDYDKMSRFLEAALRA